MGINMHVYTVYGVKLDWDNVFYEAYEEIEEALLDEFGWGKPQPADRQIEALTAALTAANARVDAAEAALAAQIEVDAAIARGHGTEWTHDKETPPGEAIAWCIRNQPHDRIEALLAKVKLMDDLDAINGEKIEDLEAKLATCEKYRDAYDEMDRIATQAVRDLEAKLAGGVIAEYDDGSTVFLSGYAGGAADGGAWSTLTLMERAPDGTLRERKYKAQGDWCATLAEIKGESHG